MTWPFWFRRGSLGFKLRTTGIKLILLNSDLERDFEHHSFIVNVNIHQKRTDSQSVACSETFISHYGLAIESHRIRWTETKDVVPTINDSDPSLHAGNPRVVQEQLALAQTPDQKAVGENRDGILDQVSTDYGEFVWLLHRGKRLSLHVKKDHLNDVRNHQNQHQRG